MAPAAVKRLTAAEAKAAIIEAVSQGATINAACASVGRSLKTHENYRATDKDYARSLDEVRSIRKAAKARGADVDEVAISFTEWRRRYLKRETYPHMQNLVDVVEGRDPSWLHPSMTWEPRRRNRTVINIPPFHAKSQTLTVDYVTYKLCLNPNFRVVIVSKKQDQAKKFLGQIRQRLTSNLFAALQAAYGGPAGFKGDGAKWTQNMLYLSGRDSDAADASIEAIGLGGQIYGTRSDLILLDDCVVGSNANEFEKQINWMESEVENRVFDGSIVVIGTRLAPQDLYAELRNGDRYLSGKSPWSYLRMPMVLETAERPEDWKTLWPKSHLPMDENDAVPGPDGMYSAWDGVRANRTRDSKPPKTWNLVYQQADQAEDATFDPKCVMGSVDRRRKPGPLCAGGWGHPRHGMEGQYVIASMDPAMTGDTFTLVGAVDKGDQKRRIMNAWCETSPTPAYIRNLIEEVTDRYSVNEWVIEKNAFQLFLIHDEAIQSFCRSRGVRISEHYCVDTKTEALSKRGWLKSSELAVGDEILTLNTGTGLSEWKSVTDVYRSHYSGVMHRYDHRNIDALCTPNHKWIRTDQQLGPMRLVESRDLNTNSVLPLARPLDETGDQEPSMSDDMIELIGWSVTEGHYRKDGPTIVLSQSTTVNPEKCERIRGVLNRLGAKWSERDNHMNNGVHLFAFSGPIAQAVRLATEGRKHLPVSLVTSLPARQRRLLHEVMVMADGWKAGSADCYCSDERSLVDAFEILSALAGYPTYTREHATDPGHLQSRRKTYNNSFMQNVGTRPVEVEWSGEIWCPSTENGTFYARRNGKTYFTGNTSRNKQDPDFGVASIAPLFGSLRRINEGAGRSDHQHDNLIELPDPDQSTGIKALIEQLVAWQPGKLGKQLKMDGPMALWFFELRAREVLGHGRARTQHFVDNPYLSRTDRAQRVVVPFDSYRESLSG